MLNTLRAMLVVAGLFGLIAAPFVGIMLVLLVTGASAGAIFGFGFLALLVSLTGALSARGRSFFGEQLRRATRRACLS